MKFFNRSDQILPLYNAYNKYQSQLILLLALGLRSFAIPGPKDVGRTTSVVICLCVQEIYAGFLKAGERATLRFEDLYQNARAN